MRWVERLLWRTFGMPAGFLGRIGGKIMAGRKQREIAARVADLLDVRRGDKILEIGFGPGIGIQAVSERLSSEGLIVGIDPSDVMMEAAKARSAEAVEKGTVRLLRGTVEQIPYSDEFFDKAFAMNSFHLWPDQRAGLLEIRRVLKRGGVLVLSFYGPARRAVEMGAVRDALQQAGFKVSDSPIEANSVSYLVAHK